MNVYLAGIRQCHLVAGLDIPVIRTPLVNLIIEGKKHMDEFKEKLAGDSSRLPVTPALKEELRLDSMNSSEKLTYLALAPLAFSGAFRIHKLLARKMSTLDPQITLLGKDVNLKETQVGKEKVSYIQVLIKSEKKDRIGAGVIVDVYESGGQIWLVKAFKKWQKTTISKRNRPAFRLASGKPLTDKMFNEMLRKLLGKHLVGYKRKVTSHSFRAGLVSLMGKLGYNDDDIMAVG